MACSTELIPRVLRDIDSGVLALDLHGRIVYLNPQCRAILGRQDTLSGRSYAEVFFSAPQAQCNDAFHQFVLDAVYQKDRTHSGIVTFADAHGAVRYIRLVSSFLKSDTDDSPEGVVLVMTDVTETEVLRRRKRIAATMFTCIIVCMNLYLLLLGALSYFSVSVSTKVLTQIINLLFLADTAIFLRLVDYPRSELGLRLHRPWYTLASSLAVSAGIVLVMVLAKLVLMRLDPLWFPPDAPFWNWRLGAYAWISYVFTCLVQEFLARSIVYSNIRKLFDGKYAVPISIAASALLFGGLHIAHGFVYMITAVVFLGSLSVLYEKHRSIWGVALIHYVLGQAFSCLGFLS